MPPGENAKQLSKRRQEQMETLNYKVLEVEVAAPKTSIQAVEELRGRICLAV